MQCRILDLLKVISLTVPLRKSAWRLKSDNHTTYFQVRQIKGRCFVFSSLLFFVRVCSALVALPCSSPLLSSLLFSPLLVSSILSSPLLSSFLASSLLSSSPRFSSVPFCSLHFSSLLFASLLFCFLRSGFLLLSQLRFVSLVSPQHSISSQRAEEQKHTYMVPGLPVPAQPVGRTNPAQPVGPMVGHGAFVCL